MSFVLEVLSMYSFITEIGATLVIMLLLTQISILLVLKFNQKTIAKGSYIATGLLVVCALGTLVTTPKGITLLGLI